MAFGGDGVALLELISRPSFSAANISCSLAFALAVLELMPFGFVVSCKTVICLPLTPVSNLLGSSSWTISLLLLLFVLVFRESLASFTICLNRFSNQYKRMNTTAVFMKIGLQTHATSISTTCW